MIKVRCVDNHVYSEFVPLSISTLSDFHLAVLSLHRPLTLLLPLMLRFITSFHPKVSLYVPFVTKAESLFDYIILLYNQTLQNELDEAV